MVCRSVCHTSEPCKNGCTDRAAFRVDDLGGPDEPCIRWGPEVLSDVAMATDFGTQFAITGFLGYNVGCMIASDTQFDSRGGFSVSSSPMKT